MAGRDSMTGCRPATLIFCEAHAGSRSGALQTFEFRREERQAPGTVPELAGEMPALPSGGPNPTKKWRGSGALPKLHPPGAVIQRTGFMRVTFVAQLGIKRHRLERYQENQRLPRNKCRNGIVNRIAWSFARSENGPRIEHERMK
jgi:hypothetical protein